MILSYKGHQGLKIEPGEISVIGTNNSEVFTEIINGLQGYSDDVKLVDDTYKSLDIDKWMDLDNELLINHQIFEKYEKDIIPALIGNMTVDGRSKLNKAVQEMYSALQEAMFMTDLPIEVNYDGNLKRLFNYCRLKLVSNQGIKPYDIIINDLKIHLECSLKSVVCFNNVASYLNKQEFCDLLSEVSSMQIPLLLVEFTEIERRSYFQKADYLFIDKDFVDWKY